MATTRTYYPMADGSLTDWACSSGSDNYALVDEASPSFTDYVSTATTLKYDLYNCIGSAEAYASAVMVPWTSWNVVVYCKRDGTGGNNPGIRGTLRYGGVYYRATAQVVTSTTGQTLTFTWTVPPWSVTGLTNWGVAPDDVEFGIQSNFITAKTITVGAVSLQCVHADHTPATPTDPDDLRVKTGQDELDATIGSQNPDVNHPVPWDAAFNARMQYADMGGCYIDVGSTEAAHDLWQSALLQFGDEYGDEVRCPDQRHAGSILQDAVQYYWRIKGVTVWGEETGWVLGGTFFGVTDSGTWNAAYHARANIRMGASHSALPVDYTVPVPFQTGYGIVTSTIGWTNEAIQHSGRHIAHYNGFTYIGFEGQDATTGTIMVYIQKINTATKEVSAVYELCDSGTLDTHFYPALRIGADHKLHVFIGGHGTQGLYYRTTNADDPGNGIDITAWGSAVEIPALSACTYLRPIIDSAGYIYLFFRHKQTHYGHMCFVRSTNNGASWGDIQFFIYYSDYITSSPSVYCGGVTIDSNDRVHIVISWWDNYGVTNRGRAISCIYADKSNGTYEHWHEFGTTNPVGYTTTTRGSDNIQYADVTKIDTCGDPTTSPLTGPFVHTNSEALVVDGNNYPHFVYYSYASSTGEETPVYYCYWSGSAWVIVDLYTDESLPKLWKYRQGGQLYYDNGKIYIYGFVKPTGLTYFGGELYCYRRTIDTDSWNGYYMSANTGKGIGMISVLPKRYAGQERELLFCRCYDIVWMQDMPNTLVRYDGADVRIVEAYNTGAGITRTEIDRLPDAFGLTATNLYFPLKTAVAANANAPTDRIYQVYFGNSAAASPPADEEKVFLYLENFENYASGSDLDDQGGWVCTANNEIMVADSFDNTDCVYTHTNKLWDGDKFCWITQSDAGGVGATKDLADAYPGMGTVITDVDIYFHLWNESGTGICFLSLYDMTASRNIRIGFDANTSEAGYQDDSGSWTNIVSCTGARYYEFKVSINSSGVSATVNGTAIVTNNTRITVFDKIGIGVIGAGINMIDGIRIVKRVATPPTVVTNQDHAEVFFTEGSARMGGRAVPVMEGSSRFGGRAVADKQIIVREASIVKADKTATGRNAGTAVPEATGTGRIDNRAVADVTAMGRNAGTAVPDVTGSGRIGNDAIPDVTGVGRNAGTAVPELTDTVRMGGGVQIDKEAIGRFMATFAPDKTAQARIAALVESELTGSDRVDNALISEATAFDRFAADVIVELVRSGRLASHLISEVVASGRMPAMLQLEAELTGRIMGLLRAEVTGSARIDNLTVAERVALARMISLAVLEAIASGRFGGTAIPDKTELGRAMGTMQADKTEAARFIAVVIGEAIATGRLGSVLQTEVTGKGRMGGAAIPEIGKAEKVHNLTRPDKTALGRIMARMVAELTETGRNAHLSQAELVVVGRIAGKLRTDKTELTRIMNRIVMEAAAETSRIAGTAQPDKTERARMVGMAIAEAVAIGRNAHIAQADKTTIGRIMAKMIAENAGDDRAANIARADKTVLGRIMGKMTAELMASGRIAHLSLAEIATITRISGLLQIDKTELARVMNTVALEMAGERSRLAGTARPDKTERGRLAERVIMEATSSGRSAHLTQTEAAAIDRVAGLVAIDKTELARIMNRVALETEAQTSRVAGTTRPDKTTRARMAARVIAEVTASGRMPQMAQSEKVELVRIIGQVITEAMESGRFKNLLQADKVSLVHISNALMNDKTVRAKVCNAVRFEAILADRMAAFLRAEAIQHTRFASAVRVQGATVDRIYNLLMGDKTAQARFRNFLTMEDTQITRLCGKLLASKQTETRVGNIFRAEVVAFGRLTGRIIMEATDMARVNHRSIPEYGSLARLCNLMLLMPGGMGRMSNRMILEAIIRGLQALQLHLGTPHLADISIGTPGLTGVYFRQPGLQEVEIGMPHLDGVRVACAHLEPLTYDANGDARWIS